MGQSLSGHRRTHRMAYSNRAGGFTLRMPSATSIKTFEKDTGGTFDVPVSARDAAGRTVSGCVRVTRHRGGWASTPVGARCGTTSGPQTPPNADAREAAARLPRLQGRQREPGGGRERAATEQHTATGRREGGPGRPTVATGDRRGARPASVRQHGRPGEPTPTGACGHREAERRGVHSGPTAPGRPHAGWTESERVAAAGGA